MVDLYGQSEVDAQKGLKMLMGLNDGEFLTGSVGAGLSLTF